MNYLEEIVKSLLLSFLLTRFEPLSWILDALSFKIKGFIWNLFCLMLTCIKCVGFWLSFALFHDIYLSCIVFFLAFLYDKTCSAWEKRIKFQ